MADNNEGEENVPKGNEGEELVPRGNEWEVVSLTESAYAAAPGPKQFDSNQDSQGKLGESSDAEASSAMFMSGHFVFPPSQHENLPLETEYNEVHNEKGGQDDASQLVKDAGDISDVKYKENISMKGLMSDELSAIPIFDGKGNKLPVSGSNFGTDAFEEIIYGSQEYTSFHSEAALVNSDAFEGQGEEDLIELPDPSESFSPNFRKSVEGDECSDSLPCEAWWKRRAISLYAHAKEANTFWSLFFAAAVMGLVIIGHRWQQDRWQMLQLKWQFGIKDETMGRMLRPISRMKDVIVGGHRPGSLIRGSASAER